jgi:outer membrane protein assembly factor BamE (lipoprotein component of BamABCDE complex)
VKGKCSTKMKVMRRTMKRSQKERHQPQGHSGAWIALLLTLLSVLAGCGASPGGASPAHAVSVIPSPYQTLTITAIDYTYQMPSTLALHAGLVDLRLVNNGTQPHQAQLARLNPGITETEVIKEVIDQRREDRAYALLTFVGGPDTVSPGNGQEALLDLPAGDYVLLCLVTGADGLPHIDKGMIHFFTVSVGQQAQSVPQSSGALLIQDHTYTLPAALLSTTAATIRVENQGTEPHEVGIVRLASGKSAQDVLAFFHRPSGPPPFEEDGGMATLAPGASGWIIVHLPPGHYAAFSILPDPKTGVLQLTQGLLTSFTVH